MNTNTNKLKAMRDTYEEKYFGEGVHIASDKALAEHLVVLTTLNSLLRIANNTSNLDEIETLTKAGRIMVEKYEKIYHGSGV